MLWKRLSLAILAGVIWQASAETAPEYIWDNTEGFTSAAECSVKAKSALNSALVLVKGVPTQELPGVALELTAKSPAVQLEAQSVFGSVWRLARQGEDFVVYTCGQRDYVVFDVFFKGSKAPVARVGVDSREKEILRAVKIRRLEQLRAAEPPAARTAARPVPPVSHNNVAQKQQLKLLRVGGVPVMRGNLQRVLCSTGELVKPVQSWDGLDRQNGMIKVQFPTQDGKPASTEWVDETLVQAKENCRQVGQTRVQATAFRPFHRLFESFPGFLEPQLQQGDGLSDAECCEFPTAQRPSHSYLENPRRYSAPRSSGKRLHAACDLYRVKNEPIAIVADGTVIRGVYYFYQSTYAIEVKHKGGFVVRYGEITGKAAPGSAQGQKLKKAQTIGYVGKTDCCTPMLHFELYSGKGSGSLTTTAYNKYQRRFDIMSPTDYLRKWEYTKFGRSW